MYPSVYLYVCTRANTLKLPPMAAAIAAIGLTGTNTKVVTRTVTGDIGPNRETAPSVRRCNDRSVKSFPLRVKLPPKRQVTAANY